MSTVLMRKMLGVTSPIVLESTSTIPVPPIVGQTISHSGIVPEDKITAVNPMAGEDDSYIVDFQPQAVDLADAELIDTVTAYQSIGYTIVSGTLPTIAQPAPAAAAVSTPSTPASTAPSVPAAATTQAASTPATSNAINTTQPAVSAS